MGEREKQVLGTESRRAWKRPALKSVGTVAEVIQAGTGKVSVITGDPGESQKVPAMEM